MKKRHNHYTFMFFPEGGSSPFTLRVHRYTLYLTVISIVLIILGLTVLLYKTGEIALKLQLVHNLKQENAQLKEHSKNLEISSEKIASIDSMTTYLHRLASVSEAKSLAPEGTQRIVAAVDRGRVDPHATQIDATQINGRTTQQRAAPAGSGYAASVPNIMPVDGWITKHFSKATTPDAHKGVDIAAADGTPIRATAMGVVEDTRNDRYLGLMVEIRHENGFVTRYAHCSQILVSAGDRVNRGQTIALVGNTGRSTAPHVHYEVIKDGKYVDPMEFIGAHKP
jgi:murein DD-endopeptidase MepM/ murein hydrolase activator NlpD